MKNIYCYILVVVFIITHCFCVMSTIKNKNRLEKLDNDLTLLTNSYNSYNSFISEFISEFRKYQADEREYVDINDGELETKLYEVRKLIDEMDSTIGEYMRERPLRGIINDN